LPVASLAGCTGADRSGDGRSDASGTTHSPRSAPPDSTAAPRAVPDADRQVLATATQAESRLLATYAATVEKHPDLQAKLAGYIHRHQQHLAALRAAANPAAAPGSPVDADRSDQGAQVSVAASATAALSGLVNAERVTATAHGSGLRTAKGSDNARLLASIAACESSHVTALGGGSAVA